MIDLATALASGTNWLDTLDTAQCKVLYINFELHPDTIKARFESVIRQKQLGEEQVNENVDVWNLRGYAAGYETLVPLIKLGIADRG